LELYKKNVLALPSFIIGLNGYMPLEVHQSASIHDKSDPRISGVTVIKTTRVSKSCAKFPFWMNYLFNW